MDLSNIEDDIHINSPINSQIISSDNSPIHIQPPNNIVVVDTNSTLNTTINNMISLIIQISNNVFQTLGKGFNECIYHKAILVDLYKTNYQIETKKIIPIEYNNVNVGYVESDVIVYDENNNIMIIIELKAQTNDLSYKEKFQVQKYMNHLNHNIEKKNIIGLVINFSQKNNTSLEVQNNIVYE